MLDIGTLESEDDSFNVPSSRSHSFDLQSNEEQRPESASTSKRYHGADQTEINLKILAEIQELILT